MKAQEDSLHPQGNTGDVIKTNTFAEAEHTINTGRERCRGTETEPRNKTADLTHQ